MLEAVNSVLQAAPLVRGNAEQVSTTESFAANPDRVQKVTQAPYVSPYYAIDVSGKVVMEIRNPESGAVIQSYAADTETKTSKQDEPQRAATTLPRGSSGGSRGSAPATARQLAAFVSASHVGASSGHATTVFA